ncbi:hypothetical protein BDB13_3863 [Rhodococcus sp. OK302]|nr:hypothetical protein BDB13_3863 [Rhodococcus sp. OK302]
MYFQCSPFAGAVDYYGMVRSTVDRVVAPGVVSQAIPAHPVAMLGTKKSRSMPGEHGVGFALNLALVTSDAISDDGIALIDPSSEGGCRRVIENSCRDAVALDQESLVGKSCVGCFVEERWQNLFVDAAQGNSDHSVAGAHHQTCCVAEQHHCVCRTVVGEEVAR